MKTNSFNLMTIFPHPDDETLGMGGVIATYAAQGINIHILCLTKGERGWPGPKEKYPGQKALGEIRAHELERAASTLGAREVKFLGYLDGDVDQADPAEISAKIAAEIRRVKPQVIVTFGPDGIYGHPDHIATSQFAHLAVVRAANQHDQALQDLAAHSINKLYYSIESAKNVEIINREAGGIQFEIDGEQRSLTGWPDWMISTQIDAHDHIETTWKAILCHQSQLPGFSGLLNLPNQSRTEIWGVGHFYRVFSNVNGGRNKEADLFAGLR
jgi:LmbE family N-acetylglucosaminyl deacetylase